MALIPEVKSIPTPLKPDMEPKSKPDGFKSSIADVRELNDTRYTTNLDGSSWTLENYYRQILGKNDVPAPPDYGNVNAVYQTYRQITHLEIMVTTPLQSSQDPETGGFTITGEANVYGVIKPSQGDAFTALAPNGDVGIFHITEVVRLSVYGNTAYQISYMQFGIMSQALRVFFQKRVVEEVHFRKDYHLNGKYPFLTTSKLHEMEQLRGYKHQLIDRFYRTYWSASVQGTPIPLGDGGAAYDPWLHRAWLNLTGYNLDPRYRSHRMANMGDNQSAYVTTVWDSIISRTVWNPDISVSRVALIRSYATKGGLYTYALKYAGYKRQLVPIGLNAPLNTKFGDSPDTQHYEPLDSELKTIGLYEPEVLELVHPVTNDDYYMFSKAFYEGDGTRMSLLEREVVNLIKGHALDIEVIKRVVDAVPLLTPLDAYYVIPTLVALIESFDRN